MNLPEQRNVYLICPVRKVTEEVKKFLDDYVARLEANGHNVHYPPRDVDQTDSSGVNIMTAHKDAMKISHEVHAYWTGSEGSVCDLGMTLRSEIPIHVIPECNPQRTEHKSFTNVILDLAEEYKNLGYIPARAD